MNWLSNTGPRAVHIGIVDDDVSFREALEGWLGSLGYSTIGFACAEDFLWSGRLDDLNCLILDVRMAGMDGLEFQAQLNAAGSQVPVVIITSQDDEATRSRALNAGAAGFFGKPVDFEPLSALLELITDNTLKLGALSHGGAV